MISDHKIIDLHQDIKSVLLSYAIERSYSKVAAILLRGKVSEVHLNNPQEAEELGRLSSAYREDTMLRFPHYDDEDVFHNALHEEKFDFANIDVVMTVSFAIQAAYPSHFSSEVSK